MEYSQAVGGCQPSSSEKVDDWKARIAGFFWPHVCVLCRGPGQPDVDLCVACEQDLPANDCACVRCATPLAAVGAICGACLKRPPFFQVSCAPFRYGYPVARLIQGLKYRREGACGRVLGVLLARRLLQRPRVSLPDVLIPTPLSTPRYRQRGFNQSYELARPLGATLGLEICADLVVRQRDTREQAGLKQKERRRNVRGAFALRKPLPARRVAILDDVITTGSTANELAKVLRRAGATTVELWAAARAGESMMGRDSNQQLAASY